MEWLQAKDHQEAEQRRALSKLWQWLLSQVSTAISSTPTAGAAAAAAAAAGIEAMGGVESQLAALCRPGILAPPLLLASSVSTPIRMQLCSLSYMTLKQVLDALVATCTGNAADAAIAVSLAAQAQAATYLISLFLLLANLAHVSGNGSGDACECPSWVLSIIADGCQSWQGAVAAGQASPSDSQSNAEISSQPHQPMLSVLCQHPTLLSQEVGVLLEQLLPTLQALCDTQFPALLSTLLQGLKTPPANASDMAVLQQVQATILTFYASAAALARASRTTAPAVSQGLSVGFNKCDSLAHVASVLASFDQLHTKQADNSGVSDLAVAWLQAVQQQLQLQAYKASKDFVARPFHMLAAGTEVALKILMHCMVQRSNPEPMIAQVTALLAPWHATYQRLAELCVQAAVQSGTDTSSQGDDIASAAIQRLIATHLSWEQFESCLQLIDVDAKTTLCSALPWLEAGNRSSSSYSATPSQDPQTHTPPTSEPAAATSPGALLLWAHCHQRLPGVAGAHGRQLPFHLVTALNSCRRVIHTLLDAMHHLAADNDAILCQALPAGFVQHVHSDSRGWLYTGLAGQLSKDALPGAPQVQVAIIQQVLSNLEWLGEQHGADTPAAHALARACMVALERQLSLPSASVASAEHQASPGAQQEAAIPPLHSLVKQAAPVLVHAVCQGLAVDQAVHLLLTSHAAVVNTGATVPPSSATTGPAGQALLHTSLLQSTGQAVAALPGDQLRALLCKTLLSPALERPQQEAGARLWTILLNLAHHQVPATEGSIPGAQQGSSASSLSVRVFSELVHLLAQQQPCDTGSGPLTGASCVEPQELGPSVLSLLYVLVMDASSQQGPQGAAALLQMVAQLQALLTRPEGTAQSASPAAPQALDDHLMQWLPWLLPLISLVQAALHYALAHPASLGKHAHSPRPGTPRGGIHGMSKSKWTSFSSM
jgi:hypothetical protein